MANLKHTLNQYKKLAEAVAPQVMEGVKYLQKKGLRNHLREVISSPQMQNNMYALKEMGYALVDASFDDKKAIVRMMVDTKKYAKDVCPFFNTVTRKGEFNGIEIVLSDENCFFAMGCLPEHPAAALAKGLGGNEFILINSGFDKMPEEYKQAILCHEYGHHVHGHLNKSNGVRKIQDEFEADAYSQSQGNDIIGALEYLCSVNPLLRNQREIKARIAALKEVK